MKTYIGVKEVEAKPMNKYEFFISHKCKEDNEEGYMVKYPDGYESWCPKRQFEEANRPFESFTDRLLVEAQDTAERLNYLNIFMGSAHFPVLSREAKDLLYAQQRSMSKYVQILGQRLESLSSGFTHNN
jgi:hypothetical protein